MLFENSGLRRITQIILWINVAVSIVALIICVVESNVLNDIFMDSPRNGTSLFPDGEVPPEIQNILSKVFTEKPLLPEDAPWTVNICKISSIIWCVFVADLIICFISLYAVTKGQLLMSRISIYCMLSLFLLRFGLLHQRYMNTLLICTNYYRVLIRPVYAIFFLGVVVQSCSTFSMYLRWKELSKI